MEQWFIVNAEGFPVGAVTPDMVFELNEGFRIVNKLWPNGMYRPKHDEATDEWVSGETAEEKAAREAEANAPEAETTEQKATRLEIELSVMTERTMVAEESLANLTTRTSAAEDAIIFLMDMSMVPPEPTP